MKNIYYLILAMAFGCKSPVERSEVKNIGELMQIMHQGRFQARVSLDTLTKSDFYGLGAMDSLSGELLVLDGQVFTSSVQDDSLVTKNDQYAKATLLVYTEITKWDTVNISDFSDIGSALIANVDTSKAFAFMLIGKPSITYHVINFNEVNGDLSKHKDGAYIGAFENEEVTVLGFYSSNAKGIYTHHGSNVHMHVISADQSIMGHVDKMGLKGDSYKLLIPKL